MSLTFRNPFPLLFSSISLQAKGFHNFGALIAEPFLDNASVLNGLLNHRH